MCLPVFLFFPFFVVVRLFFFVSFSFSFPPFHVVCVPFVWPFLRWFVWVLHRRRASLRFRTPRRNRNQKKKKKEPKRKLKLQQQKGTDNKKRREIWVSRRRHSRRPPRRRRRARITSTETNPEVEKNIYLDLSFWNIGRITKPTRANDENENEEDGKRPTIPRTTNQKKNKQKTNDGRRVPLLFFATLL